MTADDRLSALLKDADLWPADVSDAVWSVGLRKVYDDAGPDVLGIDDALHSSLSYDIDDATWDGGLAATRTATNHRSRRCRLLWPALATAAAAAAAAMLFISVGRSTDHGPVAVRHPEVHAPSFHQTGSTVAGMALLPPSPPPARPPVMVLDVVRVVERDARALLEQTGLGVETIHLHYDGSEPGTVVESDPPAATQVPQGTIVWLYVSDGPP